MNDTNRAGRDADLPTEREIEGLFRLLGEIDSPDLPVSDVEADLIVSIAEQLPVSDEDFDRGAQRLLNRLRSGGGTDPKVSAPEADATAKAAEAALRPSLYQSLRSLGQNPQNVAEQLRLNEEVLIQLDQGRARRVPELLVNALAAALTKTRDEIRRCIAPAAGDVLPMAAHGRRGAARRGQEPVDFHTIIETSSLTEDDKVYWLGIASAEADE